MEAIMTMKFKKATKHTFVFEAINPPNAQMEAPVETVYVNKSAFGTAEAPKSITLTIKGE